MIACFRLLMTLVFLVSTQLTDAIVFDEAGSHALSMRFEDGAGEQVGEAFALFQNTPNPFVTETQIGYILPAAAEVTFEVYDTRGARLDYRTLDGKAGLNYVTLNRKDFAAEGLLYYQVSTADYTATKKMILVE